MRLEKIIGKYYDVLEGIQEDSYVISEILSFGRETEYGRGDNHIYCLVFESESPVNQLFIGVREDAEKKLSTTFDLSIPDILALEKRTGHSYITMSALLDLLDSKEDNYEEGELKYIIRTKIDYKGELTTYTVFKVNPNIIGRKIFRGGSKDE